MNRSKRQKGFTLVELLAVIVIVGILSTIGIVSVTRMIAKSKEEKIDSQKNAVIMAAQSYAQSNKIFLPKSIGESTEIAVKDLKDAKYITEDILNDKGESCMEKSFVRAYKSSKDEIKYSVHIYCGNEQVPKNVVPSPVVKVDFRDGSDHEITNLTNVKSAIVGIKLKAASDSDVLDLSKAGTTVEIDGYNFTISVEGKDGNGTVEVYNSGTLSGNKETEIAISKALTEFIDVTTANRVYINVEVYNTLGGVADTSSSVGTSIELNDTNAPVCDEEDQTIYNENDWLNKAEYETDGKRRQVTIGCKDTFEGGQGSGCVRDEFTAAWPNDSSADDKKGAEWADIQIRDNAGNSTSCKRGVYVDIEAPSFTITGYKANSTPSSTDSAELARHITGSNILTETASASNSSTEKTYNRNAYSNSVGKTGTTMWLNNANYPNGVIYKIEVKDNLRLDRWTWDTNPANVNKTDSSSYKSFASTNPDASSGYFPQVMGQNGMTDYHGTTSYVIYVRLLSEGLRNGRLTVYDKAGNPTVYYLPANIDRTAPPVPSNYEANVLGSNDTTVGAAYNLNTAPWVNKSVQVRTANGYAVDNADASVSNNLSGFYRFEVNVTDNDKSVNKTNKAVTLRDGKGIYDIKGGPADVDGTNTFSFRGCDNAYNCSAYGTSKIVKIDKTNVEIYDRKAEKTTDGSTYTSYDESSWVGLVNGGIGTTAKNVVRISSKCRDNEANGAGSASGCPVTYDYAIYNYDVSTTKAGLDVASGDTTKKGVLLSDGSTNYKFYDNAGNSKKVTNDFKVYVDYGKPTCNLSATDSDGKKYTGKWLKKDQFVNVVSVCKSDPAVSGVSSGCKNVTYTTKKYNTDTDTTTGGSTGIGSSETIYDNAGNACIPTSNLTIKIDTKPPTCELTGGNNSWHKDPVTITGVCSDTGGSGCAGDVTHTYSSQINTTTAGAGGDGVAGFVSDNAGNTAYCNNNVANQTVKIDTTPPTCNYNGNDSWEACPVTVSVTCSDSGGSGCATDNPPMENTSNSTTDTVTIPSRNTVIKDKAGNSTTCERKTVNVKCDSIPPSGSCSIQYHKIENVTKSDDHSGVKNVRYLFKANDTLPDVNNSGWSTSNSGTSDCSNSNAAVYGFIRVTDNAGNQKVFSCGHYNRKSCEYWVTSCREGNTFIYTSSAANLYAGTVQKYVGGAYDKLWVNGSITSPLTYVRAETGHFYTSQFSCSSNCNVYIYSNCIGGHSTACPFDDCPDLHRG